MVVLSQSAIRYRIAVAEDVAAMAECRSQDSQAGVADPRMAAYFRGEHHPQRALAPRIGFVALMENASGEQKVAGYIAGHATRRHDCQGEVQYLFVAPTCRRHGVGRTLLRMLAAWFRDMGIANVCVCVDDDSPEARPFYRRLGATPLSPDKPSWHVWPDIGLLAEG